VRRQIHLRPARLEVDNDTFTLQDGSHVLLTFGKTDRIQKRVGAKRLKKLLSYPQGQLAVRRVTDAAEHMVGLNPTQVEGWRMRTTRQLSITLPDEMADLVRAKVESGEYASESEVIREGLRALQLHERAIESWLREQVTVAYDALKADPSRIVSVEQVRASLLAARKLSRKAG
jgi:putative addiction module CopG family antidote